MDLGTYADGLSFEQLRVLQTIHLHGSFSAAARVLRRSQAAISYQVAALEDGLDLKLFDRDTRRPRLTEAGKVLVASASDVLQRIDDLRQRAYELRGGLEARVAISVDVLVPPQLLACTLASFGEEFPTVPLELHAGILRDIPRHVASGACDVGIAGALELPKNVTRGPLVAEVQLVPVVSAQHPLAKVDGPVTSRQLAQHVHVLLTDVPAWTDSPDETPMVHSAAKVGKVWRTTDLDTRLQLVRAGLGWARVPLHTVDGHLATGALVELELADPPSRVTVQLAAIHNASRVLGPATRWLVKRLATAVKIPK